MPGFSLPHMRTVVGLFLGRRAPALPPPAASASLESLSSVPQMAPKRLHKSRQPSKQGRRINPEPWLEYSQSGWVTVPQQQHVQRSKRPTTQRQHSSSRQQKLVNPHPPSIKKIAADEGLMAQQLQKHSTPSPKTKRQVNKQALPRTSASPPVAHQRSRHTGAHILTDLNDSTSLQSFDSRSTTPQPSMLPAVSKHKGSSGSMSAVSQRTDSQRTQHQCKPGSRRRFSLLPRSPQISTTRTAHSPASKPASASQTHRPSRGRYLGTASLSSPQSAPIPLSTHTQHPSLQPTQSLQAASALAALAGPDTYISGPRILGRQRPVHRRVRLYGQHGRSAHPWWQWRQWLLSRQRVATAAAAAAAATAERTAPHSEDLLWRERLEGQGVKAFEAPMPLRLSSLYADDFDLDLDALDENVTAQSLQGTRSRQAAADRLCLQMLRELRALSLQHKTIHASHLQHLGQHQEQHLGHHEEQPYGHHQELHRGDHQQQQQLQLQEQQPALPPPSFRIFKGGGYVAADLEVMLQRSGLSPALQLQHTLNGADCILAKRRWKSGKQVDLRQQEAAASKRGVPLLFTPSLRVRDVLWALRPALLDRGLITNSRDNVQGRKKAIWMTRNPLPRKETSSISGPDATTLGAGSQLSKDSFESTEVTLGAAPHSALHKSAQGAETVCLKSPAPSLATEKERSQCVVQCQEQLLRGSITVSNYILLCKKN